MSARDVDRAELHAFLMGQRMTADGALEPGTAVRKINSEPNDFHADGTPGEVVSSIDVEGTIGYFVAFGEGAVTFIIESKLEVPFEPPGDR